jgi:hypothetical protein
MLIKKRPLVSVGYQGNIARARPSLTMQHNDGMFRCQSCGTINISGLKVVCLIQIARVSKISLKVTKPVEIA